MWLRSKLAMAYFAAFVLRCIVELFLLKSLSLNSESSFDDPSGVIGCNLLGVWLFYVSLYKFVSLNWWDPEFSCTCYAKASSVTRGGLNALSSDIPFGVIAASGRREGLKTDGCSLNRLLSFAMASFYFYSCSNSLIDALVALLSFENWSAYF